MIFALVLYTDESTITKFFKSCPSEWHLLQKKLYNIEIGGIKFFKVLDVILTRNDLDTFVYEIYYLIIKMGFRGKFFGKDEELSQYLDRLKDKIEPQKIKAGNAESSIDDIKDKIFLNGEFYE